MSIKVLDVSKHQITFNPEMAKLRGVEATFIRLAYGAGEDKTATAWAEPIKRVGMKLGGYGFGTWHYRELNGGSLASARQIMKSQVQTWIQIARRNEISWYLAIDQELESSPTQYHMGLTMDENTTLIREAAEMIKAAGFMPLLYCSVAWDYAYIRTVNLPEYLNYWFAYYGDAWSAKDFDGVSAADIPNGTYGKWWKKCYQSGRLAGWQYGSLGYGPQYGAGSPRIDRDLFYQVDAHIGEPVKPDPVEKDETITDGLYTIVITASKGDKDAVVKLCEDIQIPYRFE